MKVDKSGRKSDSNVLRMKSVGANEHCSDNLGSPWLPLKDSRSLWSLPDLHYACNSLPHCTHSVHGWIPLKPSMRVQPRGINSDYPWLFRRWVGCDWCLMLVWPDWIAAASSLSCLVECRLSDCGCRKWRCVPPFWLWCRKWH